jgi:hypothetical protein
MKRGTYGFDVTGEGNMINSAENVDILRKLWLGRDLVEGYYIGPGDPGDFDHGAWHVGCHLAGAGGVRKMKNGSLLWLEISHDPVRDEYYGSVTVRVGKDAQTYRLDSGDGRSLVNDSVLVGFIEGNSVGRISARGVNDPSNLFNLWRRQDFDQPVDMGDDGGKVWEHWCTLRDIRETSKIGTSVLMAYISLVSALGDRFAPTVARGRRDYGHPEQLCALVKSGFTARESAVWDIMPKPISAQAEKLLLKADPVSELEGVEKLGWDKKPQYYMYTRKIKSWSTAKDVKSDLDESGF